MRLPGRKSDDIYPSFSNNRKKSDASPSRALEMIGLSSWIEEGRVGKFRTAVSRSGKVVVREDYFGMDTSTILYPGLSSCIAITAVSPHGLLGAHITVGTPESIVTEMFTNFASGVGSAYVVGQIQVFKSKTVIKDFNTRKKISSKLRGAVPGINKVYFFDIAPLSLDADLMATNSGSSPQFSWAHLRKVGWEVSTDTSGFTPIASGIFESR